MSLFVTFLYTILVILTLGYVAVQVLHALDWWFERRLERFREQNKILTKKIAINQSTVTIRTESPEAAEKLYAVLSKDYSKITCDYCYNESPAVPKRIPIDHETLCEIHKKKVEQAS